MVVLKKILRKKNVALLINNLFSSSCYKGKKLNLSVNYELTSDVMQPFFILLDALYKFEVIIGDDKYLEDYIFQIEKLLRKIDNVYDIIVGINKIIGRFCALKLKIENLEDSNNKRIILSYIYDRYIVNGYLFHGFCGVYKNQIKTYGFIPEHYNNMYLEFLEVEKIFKRHGVLSIMDKNFDEGLVYFTDNFMMGCYYGANSPMYFSKLLCGAQIDNIKGYDNLAYFKNDYYGCFNNLNKVMKICRLNEGEKKRVLKTCYDQWKVLQKNSSDINVLLLKRSVLGLDFLEDIDKILSNCENLDLGDAIGKIVGTKNNKISVIQKINSKDLVFVDIPNYKAIIDFKEKEALQEAKNNKKEEKLSNAYGSASILAIIGSLFITLGVLLTIIMISQGG